MIVHLCQIKMKLKIDISKKAKYTLMVAILILVVTIVFAAESPYYSHSADEVVGACYSDGTNSLGNSCTFLEDYDTKAQTHSNFVAAFSGNSCSWEGWKYDCTQICERCYAGAGEDSCDLAVDECACLQSWCCSHYRGDYCAATVVTNEYCVNNVITGTQQNYINCGLTLAPEGHLCYEEFL